MPITFRNDTVKGIVYTTIEGSPSTDEIIGALETLLQSPEYCPGLRGVVDMRGSKLDSCAVDVRRIADVLIRYRDTIGPSRSAVVVSKTVTYGMTRMFQAYADQSSIEVELFHDIDAAREWIERET
jgi:hypothetical protein